MSMAMFPFSLCHPPAISSRYLFAGKALWVFGVGEKQARGRAASLDLTNNRQTILPVVFEKEIRTKPLLVGQELQAVGASAGNTWDTVKHVGWWWWWRWARDQRPAVRILPASRQTASRQINNTGTGKQSTRGGNLQRESESRLRKDACSRHPRQSPIFFWILSGIFLDECITKKVLNLSTKE